MKKLLTFCLIVLSLNIINAQFTVSGKVVDESGLPLPGATIFESMTNNNATTDFDGNFTIEVGDEGVTIEVSFVGFDPQQIVADSNELLITLTSNLSLDEVVVTSLGISREKKTLGYAVQELSGEALEDVKAVNPIESLSGEIAGLDIQSYNTMGGSANVVVRGYSSITGSNQALFVVDGTPISNITPNTSDMRRGGGGFDYGNAAMDINPEDVESVSVLKGAAATALYGSRASNGVILITTKKGKDKPGLGITFNSQIMIGSVDESTLPSYQYEYGAGYGGVPDGENGYWLSKWDGPAGLEYAVNTTDDASFGPKLNAADLRYEYYNMIPELTDYYGKLTPQTPGAPSGTVADFFETQMVSTNSISVEGADDSGSFRLGYTNTAMTGILPNSSIDRNSFTFSGSRNLSDELSASANITYTKTDATGRYGTGYDNQNVFQAFRQWWITNTDLDMQKYIVDQTGKNYSWNMYGMDTSGTDPNLKPHYFDNPYWMRYNLYNTDTRNRYFGNISVNYDLGDIKLLGRVAFDQYDFVKEERINVSSDDVPYYYVSHRTVSEINYDLIASYNKYLTDNLSLDANIGVNLRVNEWDYLTAETNGGLKTPDLFTLANTKSDLTSNELSAYDATKKVDGVYGRLSLGFDETYYLEGTYRSDRSSSLPKGNNSYDYSSISASVILSELIEDDFLDFAKLRLNYAEVGADVDPYRVYQSYLFQANFGGQPVGTNPSTFNNPLLKSETTKESEVGLELQLFDRSVNLDLSYYNRTTEDLITPLDVSSASGGSALYVNAGSVENVGFEAVLSARAISTPDFSWDITTNWSTYTSEVKDLGKDANGNDIEYLELASVQGGVSIGAKKGEPFGVIRGRDFIYHENGQKLKRDNGAYQRTTSNTEVLGDIVPDWTGGIKNTLKYKDFGLSFLIDIQEGGDVFSLDSRYSSLTGILQESVRLNDKGVGIREPVADGGGVLLPGVNEDGTPNLIYGEALDYLTVEGYVYMPEAQYVYDASFVKLRELSLSYKLPSDALGPFQTASISLIGRNLWIISSNVPYSDPEAGVSAGNVQGNQSGAYPNLKEIGLNLKFQF